MAAFGKIAATSGSEVILDDIKTRARQSGYEEHGQQLTGRI